MDRSTANDGRVYPPFFGNGSRLSNLVLSDAVPEPATWSMMITGFGLIGGLTRYRRRNVKVAYA
ncbi:PEPxxWA-CTERM sorting domain-containing protein [Sphingomonas sp. Leaf357]|uniref:PEPxxWA-CTERM sorting domain-containing protein n=1 Tax=Sphingomonas sp. Leaf357 TaxID=1736350 RepID=UPI0009EB4EAF|nr:PEPxxWA-CTERM sorting domain-containing protein [Sphingomonas sp. Leaf357]